MEHGWYFYACLYEKLSTEQTEARKQREGAAEQQELQTLRAGKALQEQERERIHMEKEDIQSAAMRSAKNLQADAQPSTVEQPAASKDLPKTETASASALPEGQDEKLSDVSGDPAASDDDDDSQILSDDEDLFHMMTADTEDMPESYGESLLQKHRNAILEVVSLLRPYPLFTHASRALEGVLH